MLKQLLLVMAECVVQPTESIARLGCACIRQVNPLFIDFTSLFFYLPIFNVHKIYFVMISFFCILHDFSSNIFLVSKLQV